MTAIVWDDVQNFAPSLPQISATAQAFILGEVNTGLNATALGHPARVRLLRILLAAHMAESMPSDANNDAATAGAVVTSESVGGVSRSYAYPGGSSGASSSSAASLQSTTYGRMAADMMRNSAARIGFAF